MITTRSFLSTIIKAAIAPAILPSALTYGRKWVKQNSTDIILVNDYSYVIPITFKLRLEPYYQFEAWQQLAKDIKWQPNMGETLRGIK